MGPGVKLATAYLDVTVNTRGMRSQMDDAFRGVEASAGASGERAGSRFASSLGAKIKAVVAAGGAAAALAGTVGVKTAAQLETADIAFTTMLGSAKDAKAFLKDLSDFAAKTPFDLPGLQRSAQSLISIGIDAKKVIPIMTSIGNATAGMGTGAEGVQRATIALQQMNAAGRITAEDLNQLRDAGIPVFDLLSKATGKTTKEISRMAQTGKLGKKELDQMMAALESGKGLERFNGMMDKQSKSLSGLWSTLKDTFSVGMAQAIEPLVPLLKDGLGAAIEFTSDKMPALRDGIKKTVDGFTGLKDLLVGGDYTGALRKAFGWEEDDKKVDFVLRVRDGFLGLKDLLLSGDYTSALRKAFGWEEDDKKVDQILKIRDGIRDVFEAAKTGDSSKLTGFFATLRDTTGDLIDSLPAFEPILRAVGDGLKWIGDHADLVAKAMPYLIAAFVAWKGLQAANNVVGRESVIGFGLQLGSTIALTVANRALAKSLDGVITSQRNATGAIAAGTGAENASTLSKIRGRIATVGKTIAEKAATLATKAMAAAQRVLNLVLRANPIGIVITAIMALVGVLIILYKKNETVRRIVDKVWAGIKKAIRTVVDWFSETAWPSFKKIINKVADAFSGLKDGVGKAFGGIYDKIKGTVNSVIGFLNKTFIGGLNWILSKIPGIELRIPLIPYIGGGGSPGRSTKGGQTAGFDEGGWTGPGWKYKVAGVVHADEFVVKKESQNKIRKRFPGLLDFMNKYGTLPGYAGGGLVGTLKNAILSMTNPTAGTIATSKQVGEAWDEIRALLGRVGSSLPGQIAKGVFSKILSTLMAKAKEAVAPKAGGPGGPSWSGGGTFKSGSGSISGDIIGLKNVFLTRLAAWNGALGNRYWVNSGYRSIAEQWRLWNASDKTGRMVAYPGRSKHNFGIAADLAPGTTAAHRAFASRFGLYFPMSYEPWHIQPVGYANGGLVKPALEFDKGGYLPPGPSLVVNNTRRPEPLKRTDLDNGDNRRPVLLQVRQETKLNRRTLVEELYEYIISDRNRPAGVFG